MPIFKTIAELRGDLDRKAYEQLVLGLFTERYAGASPVTWPDGFEKKEALKAVLEGIPADQAASTYEILLTEFEQKRGKSGAGFTPGSIADFLVSLVSPLQGPFFDPCCHTGTLLTHAARRVLSKELYYGKTVDETSWSQIVAQGALNTIKILPAFTGLKAGTILTNALFQNHPCQWLVEVLGALVDNGKAAIITSNELLTNKREAQQRQALVEKHSLSCLIPLPGNLFFKTERAATLWLFAPNATGQILFINARGPEPALAEISEIYQEWRQDGRAPNSPLCLAVSRAELQANNYSLALDSYFEPWPMTKFIDLLVQQAEQIRELDEGIKEELKRLTC